MAEQTEGHIRIGAPPAKIMDVIADFDSYPQWTGSVRQVEVVSTLPDGRPAQVRYLLDAGAIKDEYTLAYDWVSGTELRWHLVQGKILRALDGVYLLEPDDDGQTSVSYRLRVEVSIPMIGMLRRKAEKVIVDTALKELKKRVEG